MNLKLALAMALLLPLAGCLHESQLGPFDCDPSTGACRYEILRGDPYGELLLEISYVQGNAPDSGALDLLKQRISETTGKSTVSVKQHAFSSDDDAYTLDEVVVLEERELMAAFQLAVAELPERYQEAFSLCVVQGMQYQDAARLLGIPTGTVAIRIMRARQRLFGALSRHLERLRRPPACLQ